MSNPMSSLRAWLRHARNPTLTPAESAAGWHARCASIRRPNANSIDPCEQTTSVMSHTIIMLMGLDISPVAPLEWRRADHDQVRQKWNMQCPIDAEVNLSLIEDYLADMMWTTVSPP